MFFSLVQQCCTQSWGTLAIGYQYLAITKVRELIPVVCKYLLGRCKERVPTERNQLDQRSS